ncbi:hypothetical protein FOZ60_016302 [Perkinsus olseni]|uniref:Uncharacterized protein n=1 Tax=Perkinsus olseni TaxID=32597 RepID=A0A7J6P5Q1_PEROL|nr:hypothetical protein FOZ60_016302 [Perkinsus olseni]
MARTLVFLESATSSKEGNSMTLGRRKRMKRNLEVVLQIRAPSRTSTLPVATRRLMGSAAATMRAAVSLLGPRSGLSIIQSPSPRPSVLWTTSTPGITGPICDSPFVCRRTTIVMLRITGFHRLDIFLGVHRIIPYTQLLKPDHSCAERVQLWSQAGLFVTQYPQHHQGSAFVPEGGASFSRRRRERQSGMMGQLAREWAGKGSEFAANVSAVLERARREESAYVKLEEVPVFAREFVYVKSKQVPYTCTPITTNVGRDVLSITLRSVLPGKLELHELEIIGSRVWGINDFSKASADLLHRIQKDSRQVTGSTIEKRSMDDDRASKPTLPSTLSANEKKRKEQLKAVGALIYSILPWAKVSHIVYDVGAATATTSKKKKQKTEKGERKASTSSQFGSLLRNLRCRSGKCKKAEEGGGRSEVPGPAGGSQSVEGNGRPEIQVMVEEEPKLRVTGDCSLPYTFQLNSPETDEEEPHMGGIVVHANELVRDGRGAALKHTALDYIYAWENGQYNNINRMNIMLDVGDIIPKEARENEDQTADPEKAPAFIWSLVHDKLREQEKSNNYYVCPPVIIQSTDNKTVIFKLGGAGTDSKLKLHEVEVIGSRAWRESDVQPARMARIHELENETVQIKGPHSKDLCANQFVEYGRTVQRCLDDIKKRSRKSMLLEPPSDEDEMKDKVQKSAGLLYRFFFQVRL